jgi:hypothetical protein
VAVLEPRISICNYARSSTSFSCKLAMAKPEVCMAHGTTCLAEVGSAVLVVLGLDRISHCLQMQVCSGDDRGETIFGGAISINGVECRINQKYQKI